MAGGRERARPSSSSARGSASASPSSSSTPPPASVNAPVRVYPPSSSASRLLQALQSEPAGVAAVGVLSAGRSSAAFASANRVIGRRAFHGDELDVAVPSPRRGSPARRPVHASIHLYYDASRRCVYLLGLAHPASSTTSSASPSDGEALLPPEMAEAEHERLKMQTLLFSSCSLVFVLQRSARTSTHELKRVRALAAEKAQLVQWLSAAGSSIGKGSKRSSSSSSSTQVFAPGRCVPAAVFVVPAASDSMLNATIKARAGVSTAAASTATRSATAAYCKAIEARLVALFRSLRGGPIGSARMRDALTTANLSKERRVFTMDPSHSVVVVSRRAFDGPETRLRDVLDALSDSETESEADSMDELLKPLEDDDVGWPRAMQYQQRLLEHLNALQASGGGAKDAPGVRMELLPLPQWLKAFQSLVKLYQRMDSKRRAEAVAGSAVSADGERE